MELSLRGETLLVTGAGTGIGKAIALKLAEAGANVGIHYNRSKEEALQLENQIVSNGGTAKTFQADLTHEKEVIHLIHQVSESLGEITVLVNNAGDLLHQVSIEQMEEAMWNDIVNLNQKSVFFCSKYVIPSMKKARRGRIINISSVAARTGGGSFGVMYASSKAAISAFTKGLAKELAPFGILVNGVAPGVITTRFHDRYSSSERREEFKNIIPLGREGTPEEVANCVLFMASNLSSYMTGEMMEVNGGIFMD